MLYSDDPLAQNPQTMLRYQIDAKDGHMKILIKLNARDVGGRTPLFAVQVAVRATILLLRRWLRD